MKATDVSVIGLGNMGSALAQAFLTQGRSIAVWNRSPGRASPLAKSGARVASSAAAAMAASPLTVICVLDYAAAWEILQQPGVAAAARGRTLVQLSTGNADEAQQHAAWAQKHGAGYLDGGIMSYPRDIAKRESLILYSGAPDVFRSHAATLASLAADQRHIGADPGTANSVYLALWTFYFGAHGAFLEGAALAAAAGMSVPDFAELSASMLGKLDAGNRLAARRLADDRLAADEASVDLLLASAGIVTSAFASVQASCDILTAYFAYLARARDMGFGALDVACVFDVLAPKARGARVAVPGQTR